MNKEILPDYQHVLQVLALWTLVDLLTCVPSGQAKWWTCTRPCGRCVRHVTPMEELIGQFYPGLFSRTPPVSIDPALGLTMYESRLLDSGSAEIPNALRNSNSVARGEGRANTSLWQENSSDGSEHSQTFRLPHVAHLRHHSMGCCKTLMEYVTPPNVTIGGKVYRVVHLSRAFQFIPIGRCRPGSTCSYGECVDQYQAHWVLVYNQTENSHGPPVSFAPVEVPSHCECMNVGRP